jgi:hypothetical protein
LQLLQTLAVLSIHFAPFAAKKKKKCGYGVMKVVDKMLDWQNAGKPLIYYVGYLLAESHYCLGKSR